MGLKNTTQAYHSWFASLQPYDFMQSYWDSIQKPWYSHPPENMSLHHHIFFDFYLEKIDNVFAKFKVPLNFVSVGTCDGKAEDNSIATFLVKPWNGLFVEPMSLNYKDFYEFLRIKNATNRATMVHAALNETCTNKTVLFSRPNAEETGGEKHPHWLRRQIGHIISRGDEINADWTTEEVRCMTFGAVLKEWSSATNEKNPRRPHQILRPHALRVDTEGNDHF